MYVLLSFLVVGVYALLSLGVRLIAGAYYQTVRLIPGVVGLLHGIEHRTIHDSDGHCRPCERRCQHRCMDDGITWLCMFFMWMAVPSCVLQVLYQLCRGVRGQGPFGQPFPLGSPSLGIPLKRYWSTPDLRGRPESFWEKQQNKWVRFRYRWCSIDSTDNFAVPPSHIMAPNAPMRIWRCRLRV